MYTYTYGFICIHMDTYGVQESGLGQGPLGAWPMSLGPHGSLARGPGTPWVPGLGLGSGTLPPVLGQGLADGPPYVSICMHMCPYVSIYGGHACSQASKPAKQAKQASKHSKEVVFFRKKLIRQGNATPGRNVGEKCRFCEGKQNGRAMLHPDAMLLHIYVPICIHMYAYVCICMRIEENGEEIMRNVRNL